MVALLCFVFAILASPLKSRSRLEAENAALRHQLIVLRRRMQGRIRLTNSDRWFLIQLYRWFPSILNVLTIVRPETLVRWHRAGFRCYWRWKSRSRGGRPRIETDLRLLIQSGQKRPLFKSVHTYFRGYWQQSRQVRAMSAVTAFFPTPKSGQYYTDASKARTYPNRAVRFAASPHPRRLCST
jgi:hypothetical protein